MTAVITGQLIGTGARVGILAARFNDTIVERLVDGAVDGLLRRGVADTDVTVAWVPGALELPLAAQAMASTGQYDAVIALGAVIRGATGHYDVVVGNCCSGLARVALDTKIPVINGVLTTENIEQAVERAGTKAGNKGFDCAAVAIEMINLLRQL